MKKIIIFLAILIATILFTSCSTQQRVVYRECDCPTNRYDYSNRYSWGNPYWGWNTLELNYWNWNNLYWRTPPIIRPNTPSRYERRTTIGERPGRVSTDNTYPYRTPITPRIEVRPFQQNSQPSRIQNNIPSRFQQRTTTPSSNQPTRSRVQNNQ